MEQSKVRRRTDELRAAFRGSVHVPPLAKSLTRSAWQRARKICIQVRINFRKYDTNKDRLQRWARPSQHISATHGPWPK